MLDGLDADCRGEMRLARAGPTDQDDVVRILQELTAVRRSGWRACPKRTIICRSREPSNGRRVIAMLETDKVFAGSIPENYDRYMAPLIFEPFAADLAPRAASFSAS